MAYVNYQAQSCSGGQPVNVRVDTAIFGTPQDNVTSFTAQGLQGCYKFISITFTTIIMVISFYCSLFVTPFYITQNAIHLIALSLSK